MGVADAAPTEAEIESRLEAATSSVVCLEAAAGRLSDAAAKLEAALTPVPGQRGAVAPNVATPTGGKSPLDFWRLPLPMSLLGGASDEGEAEAIQFAGPHQAIPTAAEHAEAPVAAADFWRMPLPELPDCEDDF